MYDDQDEEASAEFAQGVWTNGTNDDVWDAIFDLPRSRFADGRQDLDPVREVVAGELLAKIERDPDFKVGDMNQEQVIKAIHRRYPILGPNPF